MIGNIILHDAQRACWLRFSNPQEIIATSSVANVGAMLHQVEKAVNRYNQQREEVRALNPVTAYDMHLQMLHRGVAVAIVIGVTIVLRQVRQVYGSRHALTALAWGWVALIGVQVCLGAFTIWSGKAADVSTMAGVSSTPSSSR